jgi:coenzyme F420 hydrogenase subunit beta
VAEVVTSGLCIGCGLCEAATRGRVQMKVTDYGSLRPTPADRFSADEEARILSACPGIAVETRADSASLNDVVWGAYRTMCFAWAGDPDLRFRGATGGVLTALGCHLLRMDRARFVLHVGPDRERPMRNRWVLSETPQEVERNTGSRYGPVAPLAGLLQALDREEPFAIIAKPCDLGAVHRFSSADARIDRLCVARLAMVCGGQSRLGKSLELLSEFGVTEQEVSALRYRVYGNPGRTRVETVDGMAFEKDYLDLWQNEAGWQIETRCTFCPDALGEASDIAAADVWPGGNPVGEDAGFNGVIVRSKEGEALLASAVAAGDLILGDTITPRQFDHFQPHQLRKKQSLAARFSGLAEAGLPVIAAPGLRLRELAETGDVQYRREEAVGTSRRAREGRFAEPLPR